MNSISRRYVLDDLEELAREKTKEMSELVGEDLQLEWPPGKTRTWDFRDWEIDWFFRAYRQYNLFELKARQGGPTTKWPTGCPHVGFVGNLMALRPSGEPYVHEFLVAWERPTARLHPHEYLTQFSAAGELVGLYGQPAERLLAEADVYAIDLVVFDAPRPPRGPGKPVIGAEIKLTSKDHQNFITKLKKCRGLSDHRPDHRKCMWILQNPTVRYMWVRSQDDADLFEVQRAADTGFDLEPVPDSQVQGVLSRQNWS